MNVRRAITDGTGNLEPTVLRKWPVSSIMTAFSASTRLIARGTEITASGSQLLPLRRRTRPCKPVYPPRSLRSAMCALPMQLPVAGKAALRYWTHSSIFNGWALSVIIRRFEQMRYPQVVTNAAGYSSITILLRFFVGGISEVLLDQVEDALDNRITPDQSIHLCYDVIYVIVIRVPERLIIDLGDFRQQVNPSDKLFGIGGRVFQEILQRVDQRRRVHAIQRLGHEVCVFAVMLDHQFRLTDHAIIIFRRAAHAQRIGDHGGVFPA